MTYQRECNGCTACCEGWLFGEAHKQHFQAGRPCHFKCETGCAIYEQRPENPCKSYKCEWLMNYDLPEWMKPSVSGVIVTRREYGDKNLYLEVLEMGKKIDSTILNWFFTYHYATDIPIRIQVDGGWNNFGPKDFLKEVTGIRCSK